MLYTFLFVQKYYKGMKVWIGRSFAVIKIALILFE